MAQTVHAAGESSPGNLPGDTRAVALTAKDETELKAVELRLRDARIPHRAIVEHGGGFDGQLMAIGVVPCDRNKVRRLLSELPLMK